MPGVHDGHPDRNIDSGGIHAHKRLLCLPYAADASLHTFTFKQEMCIRDSPNYGAGAGAGGFGGGFGGGIDLDDILGSVFGGGFGGFGGFGGGTRRANPNAPRRGADIRVSLVLSFMEAVHGCKKTVSVSRQDT